VPAPSSAKDEHAQRLPGLRHREFGHPWYQRFGECWTFYEPFRPLHREEIRAVGEHFGLEAAEERMASDGHDLVDRTWDGLAKPERNYWEGFIVWLLYRPDLLESWAGVDVLRGRVSRMIAGELVWQDSPETVKEYRDLRRRVSKNHKHRLGAALKNYGDFSHSSTSLHSCRLQ
jgi:hypothetical protein